MAKQKTTPEQDAKALESFTSAIKAADYAILVDFEATCNDKDLLPVIPRAKSEIIEIGVSIVNLKTNTQVGSWSTFVQPVIYDHLTPFCTHLTTIKQSDVDNAPVFVTALHDFELFIRSKVGGNAKVVWLSWGQYDFNQLKMECERNDISSPLEDVSHFNLKYIESVIKKRREIGLAGAVREHGLVWHGTHHRGVDDAINVGNILLKLYKDL